MYKIGQLAKETGITIRTLRYYDKVGLLKPTMVSEAGYRYYASDSIMRLQHIITLKQLGFTLAEIGKVFAAEETGADRTANWKQAIRQQITEVHKQQKRLQLLDRMLHISLHTLELRGDVNTEEVLQFIQIIEQEDALMAGEKLRALQRAAAFLPEELPIIENLPVLDTGDPRNLMWVQALREVHLLRNGPRDPQAEERLAVRLLEIGEMLFEGNDAILEKYWDWVRPEPESKEKVLGLDHATMAYIDEIVDRYLMKHATNTEPGKEE